MAELNPFQPPGEKPPSDAQLTDEQLLKLPASARARVSFGDRYFWLMVVLLGVVIVLAPPLLVGWHSFWILLFGAGLIIRGLVGWASENSRRTG